MNQTLAPCGIGALRTRDAEVSELMDAAEADPDTLDRTYQQFALINAAVSGWAATYRRYIRPQASLMRSTERATTLLDIGSGGGDLAVALARWAAHDGLRLEITAIDPDARAHAFASKRPPVPRVTFRQAFSSELVAEGAHFDLVISNHMLHHLTAAELGGLLFDSEQLAAPAPGSGASLSGLPRVLHSDITRSALAYAGFALGTLPFATSLLKGSYIRADGLTSIRRSFRPEELRAALPAGWAVERQSHFRYLVVWPGAHG